MAFMRPMAEYFSADEAKEHVGTDEFDDNDPSGWYGRLSAPGYMDCTDWTGPFDTETEALEEIMRLYDVDENGNDVDE